MARSLKYQCPVCKKPLTKREFERAFKIHEGQQKHLEQREREVQQAEQNLKSERKEIKKTVRASERARTKRMVKGYREQLAKWKERARLLERGQTPQEYGPEFEIKLFKRLKEEFDGDEIEHKGKGGDVLHTVKVGGKPAGIIVYECKWTPRISHSHVKQAAQAKMTRRAQFAVLVTCGTKRGFSGFTEMAGVLVVAPAGVLAVVGLIRNHLIEMARAGIEKRQRTKIAHQLLKFIKSTEFKNPIEEIVRTSENLREGIMEEFRWHKIDWEKRWNAYGRIRWDGFAIQENLRSVLHGGTAKPLTQPRDRLALPPSS